MSPKGSVLCSFNCRITERVGTEKIWVLDTFFFGALQLPDTNDQQNKRKTETYVKKCDIFTKKFLFVPINLGNYHWTLAVVVNPGKILNHYKAPESKKNLPMALVLYMDSLEENAKMRGEDYTLLLGWLENKWHEKHKGNGKDAKRVFTKSSLPKYEPNGE